MYGLQAVETGRWQARRDKSVENMLQEQIDDCVYEEAEGMDKNQNGREGGIMIEESERKKE